MSLASPHPLDVIIGHQLRLRRRMMGMSQLDIAKRVGITFQQIQKYENGSNSLSARRLYELSQRLEVSPLYFYALHQDGEYSPPSRAMTTQTIHLVQDFTAITSVRLRNGIAALVRTIAGEHPHAI